jgi:hypothetical protein
MDDVVEDVRRKVEVLLSIWENQSHGKAHNHGLNCCNRFVPPTRTNYSSSESSESWDGMSPTAGNGANRTGAVRWAESDVFIGKSRENRSLSSASPGNVDFENGTNVGTSFGTRRVT